MRFHYAAAGSALVRHRDRGVELRAGDFALLPHGGPSTLEARESSAVYTARVRLDGPATGGLVGLMPDALVACCFGHREPMVAALVAGMAQEGRAARAGSASLLAEIGNVVVLAAIRSWVEGGCGTVGGWTGSPRSRPGHVLSDPTEREQHAAAQGGQTAGDERGAHTGDVDQ